MNIHTYVCGTMLTYIPMSYVKSHLKPTSDVRECSANNFMYYDFERSTLVNYIV